MCPKPHSLSDSKTMNSDSFTIFNHHFMTISQNATLDQSHVNVTNFDVNTVTSESFNINMTRHQCDINALCCNILGFRGDSVDAEQNVSMVTSLDQDCAIPGFMLMIQSTVSSRSVM